jgi:uncharacterized OsmC-like protein
MPIETVSVDWVSSQQFLLKDQHDFPIVMTQPMGVNGADLLPLSLIGCAAWDVMTILKKQRQAVTGLKVTAESERDGEPPWRFRSIHSVIASRDAVSTLSVSGTPSSWRKPSTARSTRRIGMRSV